MRGLPCVALASIVLDCPGMRICLLHPQCICVHMSTFCFLKEGLLTTLAEIVLLIPYGEHGDTVWAVNTGEGEREVLASL